MFVESVTTVLMMRVTVTKAGFFSIPMFGMRTLLSVVCGVISLSVKEVSIIPSDWYQYVILAILLSLNINIIYSSETQ